MRRILVAVDESDASRRAAAFVNGFFKGDDVSIVAVNVAKVPVEWLPAPYGGTFVWPAGPVGDESLLDAALAREEARGEAVAAAQAPRTPRSRSCSASRSRPSNRPRRTRTPT